MPDLSGILTQLETKQDIQNLFLTKLVSIKSPDVRKSLLSEISSEPWNIFFFHFRL